MLVWYFLKKLRFSSVQLLTFELGGMGNLLVCVFFFLFSDHSLGQPGGWEQSTVDEIVINRSTDL